LLAEDEEEDEEEEVYKVLEITPTASTVRRYG